MSELVFFCATRRSRTANLNPRRARRGIPSPTKLFNQQPERPSHAHLNRLFRQTKSFGDLVLCHSIDFAHFEGVPDLERQGVQRFRQQSQFLPIRGVLLRRWRIRHAEVLEIINRFNGHHFRTPDFCKKDRFGCLEQIGPGIADVINASKRADQGVAFLNDIVSIEKQPPLAEQPSSQTCLVRQNICRQPNGSLSTKGLVSDFLNFWRRQLCSLQYLSETRSAFARTSR